ncbi:hypothetical protein IFM53868_07152 [Aspergillus udagawae]|uniref:Uncharacterized protein n=1 Tax=Aspergillus udagawae TaxID=91492 RepID=A0ABQ1B3Z9_9EURO|nr:hypothetical protein IFM53868_07152 [Aspergillus udagawae]
MATDNSSTLVRRSTKRSFHENDVTEWENMVKPSNCLLTVQSNAAGPQSMIQTSESPLLKSYLTAVILSRVVREQLSTGKNLAAASKLIAAVLLKLGLNLLNPTKKAYIPILGVTMQSQSGGQLLCDTNHRIIFGQMRVSLLIHILRTSGKGKITCTKLQAAAEQKAAADKVHKKTLEKLKEIIAIRKEEEQEEKRCDHDGIAATGGPDEELNYGVIQLSGPASDEGRGSPSVGSPEDQIEEVTPTSPSLKSSTGFTPSSYPSTFEAPANTMYYHGSPEDQIEEISPTSPVKSSPGFTPNPYPSVSEAPANPIYYHESQYQEPYLVSQSINFRARQDCSSHP